MAIATMAGGTGVVEPHTETTIRRPLTTRRELDQIITRLREGVAAFARLSLPDRLALARAMLAGYLRIGEPSV
jgi:hypothetical protein